MKKLYSLIFILALSASAFAQCNPAIPNNAVVISTTQTTGFGGSNIWVCAGVTLTSNGGSNNIFLEVGATIMAGGGSNTIYCPAGATVNVSSGSNIIYYVNTIDLVSTGGGPTLNQCTSINYDYSNAPTPGCGQTTGIYPERFELGINFFPNPSNGTINISGNVNGELKIFNALGEEVFNQQISKSSNLQINLPKGIYFAQLISEEKLYSQKIIIP